MINIVPIPSKYPAAPHAPLSPKYPVPPTTSNMGITTFGGVHITFHTIPNDPLIRYYSNFIPGRKSWTFVKVHTAVDKDFNSKCNHMHIYGYVHD
jgi:hypothetical protein